MKELHALAQTAFHHLGTCDHLSENRGDFGGAKIELLVEIFHRLEYLLVAQMRVVQRRNLRALLRQKIDFFIKEPAIFLRLSVEEGARIRRGERDLDRVRIDFLRKIESLLD